MRSNLAGNAGSHVDFVDSGIGEAPPWLLTESQFLRWDKAISSPNTQKSLAPQIGILSKNPSIHGVFARVKRPNLRSWGKLHDVHALDLLLPEAGAIYVMDRGYVDFARLYVLHQAGAFFVTRAKSNLDAHRVYSAPTDRATGIIADQTIALDGYSTSKDYPVHLRRVRFKDAASGKRLVFLTNHFTLPAALICDLYKSRWQVELFFKWIKQHLRIKQFYGTSDNAVRTQIWIAVSVYVLVAIVKKRLGLEASLYTLLQVFSVTLFEKMPMSQAFPESTTTFEDGGLSNQLNLFDY